MQDEKAPRTWPDDISDEEIEAEMKHRVDNAKEKREEVGVTLEQERSRMSKICENIFLTLVVADLILFSFADQFSFIKMPLIGTLALGIFLVAGLMWVLFVSREVKTWKVEKRLKQDYPKEYKRLKRSRA